MEKMTRTVSPLALLVVVGLVLCAFLFVKLRGGWYETVSLQIGDETFVARVADSASKREQGLSGTANLEKNEGMLFVFPAPAVYAFWMKDMEYPIDIIWLNTGKIVDIAARVPPPAPGTPDEALQKYASRVPADAVVEVVAGTADRLGLKIGDTVKIMP